MFHPFRKDSKFFPDNFDKCEEKFRQNQNRIKYIKCRVMEYLQLVEDSRAQAEELISEAVADELDAQKEQDEEDCRKEGIEDLDTFVVQDPNFAVTNDSSEIHSSEGVFTKSELQDINLLKQRTDSLDKDQRFRSHIYETGAIEYIGYPHKVWHWIKC